MGTACPRVRNLVTRPDSAHGISQLGYREPLESSVKVWMCVCVCGYVSPCVSARARLRACGPIEKHALPSIHTPNDGLGPCECG